MKCAIILFADSQTRSPTLLAGNQGRVRRLLLHCRAAL